MKYYTPFLLLFLLLGCIGCNKQRPVEQTGALLEIPLYSAEPTVLTNLSDVAEKVEFCNLSSEVSFKKKIPNDVALTDSFVFVLLDDGIYQFASNGDFVRVIGQRGKGTGEFKRLMPPLEVDADNQICYVADKGNQKIMGFNY
ncbi:MAG: 6-bladed beta-propeller, partial [Tannerellaceae bacterium]